MLFTAGTTVSLDSEEKTALTAELSKAEDALSSLPEVLQAASDKAIISAAAK